jgi:hypothetical protein
MVNFERVAAPVCVTWMTPALFVPSRVANEPAGPLGHVVNVIAPVIVMLSSMIPETLIVAPEAALLSA